jgi:hypothetical protein
MKVEGSTDGTNWRIFAKTETLQEARESASKCIKNTKYTYVRIIGDRGRR